MNTHDRGAKKWTTLMLPEHVEALQNVFTEVECKEKPILDEQQKVEMDMQLQLALKDNLTVEITYFTDATYHTLRGKPVLIDVQGRYLKANNGEKIKLDDLTDVNIL